MKRKRKLKQSTADVAGKIRKQKNRGASPSANRRLGYSGRR